MDLLSSGSFLLLQLRKLRDQDSEQISAVFLFERLFQDVARKICATTFVAGKIEKHRCSRASRFSNTESNRDVDASRVSIPLPDDSRISTIPGVMKRRSHTRGLGPAGARGRGSGTPERWFAACAR